MAPPMQLGTTEDRTVPVVVRMPRDSGARAHAFRSSCASAPAARTRAAAATFMTPGRGAGEDQSTMGN